MPCIFLPDACPKGSTASHRCHYCVRHFGTTFTSWYNFPSPAVGSRQSSVLARCGLTRRTFSPSRRTTWGQYYVAVETSMVDRRLFSRCVRCACPQSTCISALALLLCARPDTRTRVPCRVRACLVGSCRQVGISSTYICSGLVEARRGATGRRWHGEQQCGWDLSCHLTFTHLHPCLSRMLSLSPRAARSCPHAHVLAHAHAVAHAHPRPHLSHFIPRRSSSSSQTQPGVVRSLVCGAAILH